MDKHNNINNRLPTEFGSADNSDNLYKEYLSVLAALGINLTDVLDTHLKNLATYNNILQGLINFTKYASGANLRMSDGSNRLEIDKGCLEVVVPLMSNGVFLAKECIEDRIENLIGEDKFEQFLEVTNG